MAAHKEDSVEQYLIDRVKATGGETRKVKWPGHRGAPDRLIGWPRLKRYAFVELKHADQAWGLQAHQAREITKLQRMGLEVCIVNSKAAVDALVRHMTAGT